MILLLLLVPTAAVAFLPSTFIRNSKYHAISRHHFWHQSKETTSPSAQFTSIKTHDEEIFIKKALDNSLFSTILDESFEQLINAFERKTAQRGDIIIKQGDSCEGGYVYLVEQGSCRVLVDNITVPEPYGIIGESTLFGEMGILYDEKRAATIMVESDSLTYYQIAGNVFKKVLSASSSRPLDSFDMMKEIDKVINTISAPQTLYGGNVIQAYRSERFWLWQQYAGTIFKINIETTLIAMVGSALFVFFAKTSTHESFLWESGYHAPADASLNENLAAVHNIWNIQQTLTTLVLTFFVNQSFSFWRSVYHSVREVQGSLSYFNLLLATNVIRRKDGSLSQDGIDFLDDVGQCTRLFHVLFWASRAKRFSVLLSEEGLQRMESRGLMSPKQLDILLSLDLPLEQLFSAPLEWMIMRCNQAVDEGILPSDNATKSAILRTYIDLRNAFASIINLTAGRMPLSYVQFVQILVDTTILVAPFALYVDIGEYSVIAVGLVATFYSGLNRLAKIFLDPLNNEGFFANTIFFDLTIIVSESERGHVKMFC